MIGVKNQDQLVNEVVAGLLHPTYPTSWNLVVPPGFGEDTLGEQIAAKLRTHEPKPFITVLSSDSIQSVTAYVRQLRRQWSETSQIAQPIQDEPADVLLQNLLGLLPTERPVIQVLKRFHKILDSLQEEWVLGALRSAEQNHRLRTVAISPYPHEELKKRWKRRGHIFSNSDYGDTHMTRIVELLSAEEILAICRSKGVPDHVSQYVLSFTGGYPEPFDALIENWIRMGQPPLRPEVRLEFRKTAEQRLRRFVKWLDPLNETRYRDLVIDLHYRVEAETAYDLLSYHPWKRILLDDDGLRAECVGHAAVSAAISEAIDKKAENTITSNVTERARTMYERRQYSTVLRLLEEVEHKTPQVHLQTLRAHASVMSVLYATESSELGVDTDWSRLRRAVKDARKVLEKYREIIPSYSQIESRYDDLEQVSESIIIAMSGGKRRVVDILAGLTGHGTPSDPKTALLLLALKAEAGRAIAGDTSACQSVLALPEQIFRVWVFWRLGVNYYDVPADYDETWQEVKKRWRRGDPTRPQAGEQFSSFALFAYFVLAQLLRNNPNDKATALEPDFQSLDKALSLLDDVRNDSAHALSLTNSKLRSKYFDLIDRWLDGLFSACPERVSREELLAIIEPLPIVDEHGAVIWV